MSVLAPAMKSEMNSLNGAVPELKSKNSHSSGAGLGGRSMASFNNGSNVGVSQGGGAVAEFSESNRRQPSQKRGAESNSIQPGSASLESKSFDKNLFANKLKKDSMASNYDTNTKPGRIAFPKSKFNFNGRSTGNYRVCGASGLFLIPPQLGLSIATMVVTGGPVMF
jgi:hypothetical protein